MRYNIFHFAGLVALFMVVITVFTGCDTIKDIFDPPIHVISFDWENRSSYTIKIDILPEYDINPKSFTIEPGSNKEIKASINYIQYTWHRTDTGDRTGVIKKTDIVGTIFFYNDGFPARSTSF